MTKSCMPAVALIAALLLALTLGADAATLRGIPLNSGDSATSSISPAGDQDVYVLDALAGSALTVMVSPARGSALRPTLSILGPSGTPLDLTGSLASRRGRITVKKLPIASTGRHAIVVGGESKSEGGYQLKTKCSVPKKLKLVAEPLAPGGTLEVPVPGMGEFQLKAKIKDRDGGGFAVLSVLNPSGTEVPGAAAQFEETRTGAKASLFLSGPLGDFRLVLGDASEETTLDIVCKAKYPKTRKRKLSISAVEPIVDDLDPSCGRAGDGVTITGANFSEGGLVVLFGENPSSTVTRHSDTEIAAVVPAGSGEVPVTVYNGDGQSGSSPVPFTYIPAPCEVDSVLPDGGPDTGGTTVDVFGQGLASIVTVRLGGAAVSSGPAVIDDAHLRFVTDAHDPGPASLVLVDEWGREVGYSGTFTFYGQPSIALIEPARGSIKGGTSVLVTGDSLPPGTRAFLDGVEAEDVEWLGRTQIRFLTPAHELGRVDLRVEDPWGRSATAPGGFEYVMPGFTDATGESMPANTEDHAYGGRTLALGDMDGDRSLDVVIGRTQDRGPKTFVLVNDGEGSFTDGRLLPKAPGNGDDWDARSAAVGDVDGDGDLDLVLTCTEVFQASKPISYPVSWWPYTCIANRRPYSSTRVLLNDGKGNLTHEPGAVPDPTLMGADLLQGDSVTLGDVDGDDDLDIVLSCHKSIGEITYTTKQLIGVAARYFDVTYRDHRPATRVLLNDGKGVFTDETSSAMPGLEDGDMFAGDRVLLGDVDGDEDLDVLLTGDGFELRDDSNPEFVKGSKTRVLLNDGKGSFENATADLMPRTSMEDDWGGVGMALADLDGDGTADLVLTVGRAITKSSGDEEAIEYLPSTRVLLGGDFGFEDVTDLWMPAADLEVGELWRGRDVAVVDVGGDGFPDVFLVDTELLLPIDGVAERGIGDRPSLRWLANSGEWPLADTTEAKLPAPADTRDHYQGDAIVLGDVDGDDDLDLVLTTELSDWLQDGKRPTRLLKLE